MPWPRKQAIAIMLSAQRKKKPSLARKARDSLRGSSPKARKR